MPAPTARNRYSPSGLVDLATFLPLTAMAFVSAGLLSVVMYMLFAGGFYWVLIVPIFAGGLLAFVLTTVVRVANCRSPLIATLFGFLCGTFMYVGYFYVGMVVALGIENAGRLDMLPDYISYRAGSDVQRSNKDPENVRRLPVPLVNWGTFAVELAFVLCLTVGYARVRAARPFCEACGRWKEQSIRLYQPGSGKTMAQWVDACALGMLVAVPDYMPGRNGQFTSVAVESCPDSASDPPCPVYLSIKDVIIGGDFTAFQRFDAAVGTTRVARVELAPYEIAAIAPVFPELRLWLSPPAASGRV